MISAAAEMKRGRLELKNRKAFAAAVQALPDGHYILTLDRPRKPRSVQANRYYFGCVVSVIGEETGVMDPEEMHDRIAFKFLRTEDDPVTGAPRRLRTRDMDSKTFSQYVDKVILWAEAEMGWRIPRPDELDQWEAERKRLGP